jgi:hypothetical protein
MLFPDLVDVSADADNFCLGSPAFFIDNKDGTPGDQDQHERDSRGFRRDLHHPSTPASRS